MGTYADCSDKDDIEKCKPWVGTESSGKIEDEKNHIITLELIIQIFRLLKVGLKIRSLKLLIFIGGLISYVSIPIIISQFYTLQELYKHVNEDWTDHT